MSRMSTLVRAKEGESLSFSYVVRENSHGTHGKDGSCSCSSELSEFIHDGFLPGYPRLIAIDDPFVDVIPFLWDFGPSPVDPAEDRSTWMCNDISLDVLAYLIPTIHEDPELPHELLA